jgi:hypothetical protein
LVPRFAEDCHALAETSFYAVARLGAENGLVQGRTMTNSNLSKAENLGGIITGVIVLASFVISKEVTALHPLFGLLLLPYLYRCFTQVSSTAEQLQLILALSLVSTLLTCYPVDIFLDDLNKASWWDEVLATQCIVVSLCAWVARGKFQPANPQRGGS